MRISTTIKEKPESDSQAVKTDSIQESMKDGKLSLGSTANMDELEPVAKERDEPSDWN